MVTTMSNVFISHAHGDSAFVSKLANDLNHRGLTIWSADQELEPGDRWAPVIEKAIHNADTFLVVLSDKSEDSDWMRTEVALALSQDKRVVPIYVTEQPDVPYILTAIQGVDLSDPRKYGVTIDRLAALLSKKEKHVESHDDAEIGVRLLKARLDSIMLEHEKLTLERTRRINGRFLAVSVALIASIASVGGVFLTISDIASDWKPLVFSIVGAVTGGAASALLRVFVRARRRTEGDQ